MNLGWIEGLIAAARFSFFGGWDVMGNMDGGSGGWKDICTYLTLPEEGVQFIRF